MSRLRGQVRNTRTIQLKDRMDVSKRRRVAPFPTERYPQGY